MSAASPKTRAFDDPHSTLEHHPSIRDRGHGNRLVRLWKEQYGVSQPLEVDSWGRRLWNSWVVATLLNTFPHTAKKILSRSRGELLRLLTSHGEGGSYPVLRAMYTNHDPKHCGDVLNRMFMQSPGIKGIRNRRIIAQHMLDMCIDVHPKDSPMLVMAIGGGDGNLELEVIARSGRQNVYYCGVDKDERASEGNQQVLKEWGLEDKGMVASGTAAQDVDLVEVVESARRKFSVPFNGAAVTVCHGITEYMDVGRNANSDLARLLTQLYRCTSPEGTLLISQGNQHDRVRFLERGLGWHMRLRSKEELAAEVEKAGWQISLCEQEPMEVITMCLAVKSNGTQLRIDRQEQLGRHRPSAEHASRRQAASLDR